MTAKSHLRLLTVVPEVLSPPPPKKAQRKRTTAKPRKRADGEGSVFQRSDGRWCVKLTAQRGSGRHKLFTAKTRAEVLEKRNAYLRQATLRGKVPEADPRLDRWLQTWLEDVKQRCAPNTYKARCLSVRHIVEHLGKLRLSEIVADDVDHMMRAMADAGRAVATVNLDRDALVAALNIARRRSVLVGNNPASLASRLKAKSGGRHKLTVPTSEEVAHLFRAAADHRLFAAFVIVAKLGLRNAEVCGLRWTDLDLDGPRPTLAVTGQILRIDRVLTRAPPKAGSSGVLGLGADVVEVLRAHRQRQHAEREAAGAMWRDTEGMVFTQEDGGLVYGSILTNLFKRTLRRAGLPTSRPVHTLRHFVGTTIADKVGPKAAQQALRHKSMATTMAYYCHDTPEAMDQAVSAMAGVIVPSAPAAPKNDTNDDTNGDEKR